MVCGFYAGTAMVKIIVGVICTFALGELSYRYGSGNNLVVLLGAAGVIISGAITLALIVLELDAPSDGGAEHAVD